MVIKQKIEDTNYITVKIGKHYVRALLDTGSVVSIMSYRIARFFHLPLQPLVEGDTTTLFSANGSIMTVKATTDLPLYFSGLRIPHTVKIVDNVSYDLILGVDFLSQNEVIIDYKLGFVSICDDLVRVPFAING